jgi:DNA-binding transcriptional ArsR family regulator
MQGQSKESSSQDTALKQAVSHPKRLEMLGYLAGEKTGIDEVELTEALDLNPPLVKYHLRVLQSADLVAPVEDSEPGAIDRYAVVAADL